MTGRHASFAVPWEVDAEDEQVQKLESEDRKGGKIFSEKMDQKWLFFTCV